MDTFRKAVKVEMEKTVMPETKEEFPEKLSEGYYRVRKIWKDTKSQKGAYKVLQNAKKCADKYAGYAVFDNSGKKVYDSCKTKAYRVRVDISNLNIRKGPGTHMAKTGEYTGVGVFTIVAESSGPGSKKGWGKLKSGKGWISLDYAERI